MAINEWLRSAEVGRLLPEPRSAEVGAPFQLVSHEARPVSDRDFRGRRMLLIFSSLAEESRTAAAVQVISEALTRLGEAASGIAPILVTLDPANDTPARLSSWLSQRGAHAARWTALTGATTDVLALARAYHVALPDPVVTGKGMPPAGALMLHLMDESGGYLSHRTLPNDPNVLSDWLRPIP